MLRWQQIHGLGIGDCVAGGLHPVRRGLVIVDDKVDEAKGSVLIARAAWHNKIVAIELHLVIDKTEISTFCVRKNDAAARN